jgi:hypothetical protein
MGDEADGLTCWSLRGFMEMCTVSSAVGISTLRQHTWASQANTTGTF